MMAVDYSTAIANLKAELDLVTATPGPNYSINGESVQKSDYIEALIRDLEKLEQLQAGAGGPWTVTKRGIP